jgi:hypothetical protein
MLLDFSRGAQGVSPVCVGKSGQTVSTDHIRAAQKSTRFAKELALKPWLIYGGEDDYERNGVRVLGWSAFSKKDLR